MAFDATITQVTFVGDSLNPTLLRYAPGQYYGYYSSANSTIPQNGSVYVRRPDNLFKFNNGSYITVRHIHANGNKDSMNIGGHNGAGTYQIGASGLCISNSAHHISIEHCSFEGFCLDGILLFSTDSVVPPPTYIDIRNTHCPKNGRNGISPCSNYDLSIKKCSFNENATGVFWQQPGMGMDFEPDHFNTVYVRNVVVDSVTAKANHGLSLALQGDPIIGSGASTVKNCQFLHCEFLDYDNLSSEGVNGNVFIQADSLYFESCEFSGDVIRGCFNNSAGMHASTFNTCSFNDDADQYGNYRNYGYRVRSEGVCADLNFIDCEFVVKQDSTGLIFIHASDVEDIETNTFFQDCTFSFESGNLVGNSAGFGNTAYSKIAGATFYGNNSFSNNNTGYQKVLLASSWNIIGSNMPCDPFRTSIDSILFLYSQMFNCVNTPNLGFVPIQTEQPFRIGKLDLNHSPANTYADLLLGREAYWQFTLQGCATATAHSVIEIGEYARIISSSGTGLSMDQDTLKNYGQLIADDHGSIAFNGLFVPAALPHVDELFFVHKNRNLSAPNYTLGAQCITGSHPGFYGTPSACAPNYDSVAWNSTFTFLYSIAYNACNWNANVNYMVKGGTPPYSVTINNAGPPFTGLGNGQYTVQVVDAQLCSATFAIQVAGPQPLQFAAPVVSLLQCNGGTNGQIVIAASGGTGVLTYGISPSAGLQSPAGTFTGLTAQNYTITATDVNGCTSTTTVNIAQPAAVFFTLATPTDVSCNGGTNGQIVVAATGGTGTITYTLNPNIGLQSPAGTFTALNAQNYTVTATDANGCAASTTQTLTEPATAVGITSLTPTDISCFGGSNGQLVVIASGGTGQPTYTLAPAFGTQSPAGTFTALNAQNYTVTATDANGCAASTTALLSQPFALNWLAVNLTNVNCSTPMSGGIQVQASGGNGPYTYSISPNASQSPAGNFAPLVAGNYTVTATDANGCTLTTSVTDLLDPAPYGFCCTTGTPPVASGNNVILNTPGLILKVAPTASDLLAQYATGQGVIAGKQFYIDGQFTINHDLELQGCTLWFTPGSQIVFNPGLFTLDLNGSTLQASCDTWVGIIADDAQQKVIIENNSTVRQAIWGVYIANNALAEITDSHFEENGHAGLFFSDMTLGNYAGVVKRNTFSSTNTLPGMGAQPYCGIQMRNVKHLEIGDLAAGNEHNTFEGMHTGIFVQQPPGSGYSNIVLYNNVFNNITDGNLDHIKVSNCYTSPKGAAIFSKADGAMTIVSYLDVQNTTLGYSFTDCDKGIVCLGSGLTAKNLIGTNCLLGIMCNSLYSRHYIIEDNKMHYVHMGVQVSNWQRSASIYRNEVIATKSVFSGYNWIKAPVGIRFDVAYDPYSGASLYQHIIKENEINISTITGIGLYNGNSDGRLYETANSVQFSTGNTIAAFNYTPQSLIGYWNENNSSSKYVRNTTNGPTNLNIWTARSSMGMYMKQSKHCKLDCNRLKFTRFGFFVEGDNFTAKENVKYNKCNANGIPWFFSDLGSASTGTFGNVGAAGTGGYDNGNEFLSTTNPIDWRLTHPSLNQGNYKIFRLSIVPSPDQISTTSTLLSFSESGPPGVEYQVGFNTNSYTDPCIDDNSDLPDDDYILGDIDSSEWAYSMAVAADSLQYVNYQQVGSWIDKYRLFNDLDTDSLLLNSNLELLSFFDSTSTTLIGAISYANRMIALLYDSTTNSSNYAERFHAADSANNLIVNGEDWEMNEKIVNDVLLLLTYTAVDSLDSNMVYAIRDLASSCPFVEGNAVYRARSIHSIWEPDAVFDDRLLCMQGNNKSDNTNSTNIDSLIIGRIKQFTIAGHTSSTSNADNTVSKVLDNSSGIIQVYPNPASSSIIISYNSSTGGIFKLYNSLGETVMEIGLSESSNKVHLQLGDLTNGIYHYEIEFAGMKKTIGKLSVFK